MKYAKLYERVKKNGSVIIRVKDYPQKIIVPSVGYVVAIRSEMVKVSRDNRPAFDAAIDNIRNSYGEVKTPRFILLVNSAKKEEIIVCPVEVFKDKKFALGVAWGIGADLVFDLAGKSRIWLQW